MSLPLRTVRNIAVFLTSSPDTRPGSTSSLIAAAHPAASLVTRRKYDFEGGDNYKGFKSDNPTYDSVSASSSISAAGGA